MNGPRTTRMLRGVAVALAALVLTACTGLPMSGDVNAGLELGEAPEVNDLLLVASGPPPGASPEEIVEGFLEAAITPADNWSIARTFLTPELQPTWRPGVGVSIDAAVGSRSVSSTVPDDDDDATTGDVTVQFDLVANVDEFGAYSESTGASNATFTVKRLDDGEWRIAKAPDGIVIDESRFSLVFDGYPLQYFDQSWTHLVPDVRWFPRRTSIATTVTQNLIGGAPSPWLEQSVQSAFPADVELAQDAVPIVEQVAEVALTAAATRLNQATLARMRTQLEETFEACGVHVSQVKFTVDGRPLNAGVVKLRDETIDPGSLILTDDAFGAIVGDQISPIPGISEEIVGLSQDVAAIDVAADSSQAAVQLADGNVYRVSSGRVDQFQSPVTTVAPSMDPFGYTWTVAADAPAAVQAWGSDVSAARAVAKAWPTASSISALRVSADGARVAAVITVGGQHWVVVAAVVRDDGVPVELGPVKQLARIDGAADDLVWLGATRLAVLIPGEGAPLLTQMVGGPGTVEAAPAGADALAGARTAVGVRVRDAEGTLFAHAGSAWREIASGVRVLATRAGE